MRRRKEKVELLFDYYDKCETIENCTVQILTNTKTGETSVGWWRNDDNSRCDRRSV